MLNHQERRILIISCFGHFMSHFNMLVFPAVLLPLTTHLNLAMAQVLGLSFWMYLLFGLTALPWGMIADQWGAKSLMLLFFLGAGLSGVAAATWIDSPMGLALALAGIGVFSGISHPIGLGMISKGVGRMSMALGMISLALVSVVVFLIRHTKHIKEFESKDMTHRARYRLLPGH